MELIIAILFFALSGTLCIQLFVKSHLLKQSTEEQNLALIHSQNLAELYYASDGDYDLIANTLKQDSLTYGSSVNTNEAKACLLIYFNKDWQSCTPVNAFYRIDLLFQKYEQSTGLSSAQIRICYAENHTVIYELPLQTHIPLTKGEIHEKIF